jgi:hypothetical protein
MRDLGIATETPWLNSTLAEWMDSHYGTARALLRKPKVDWSRAAEVFAAHGLTDDDGKPPTSGSVKRIWAEVEAGRRKPKVQG